MTAKKSPEEKPATKHGPRRSTGIGAPPAGKNTDNRSLDAICPKCQRKATYSLRGKAAQQEVRCANCGKRFDVDTEAPPTLARR